MSQKKVVKIVRFIISGLSAAIAHFSILITLHEKIGLSVVSASTVAFLIAIAISFLLQKLWVFKHTGWKNIRQEIIFYILIGVGNLFFNALLMFLGHSILGIRYLPTQVVVSSIVAIESYLLYKILFKNHQ